MERLISILIGYCFGIIQTGYWLGRFTRHKDIRDFGSHNSGSTNVLRTWGMKPAFFTFLGDALKAIVAIVIVRLLFRGANQDVFAMYAALGVTLGHDYPFYMHFKGGKGIASLGGIMAAMDFRIAVAALVIFSGVVAATKYVSLGSILISITFCIMNCAFCAAGMYKALPANRPEIYAISVFLMALAIYRHRANIRRLMTGTENRINFHKHAEVK